MFYAEMGLNDVCKVCYHASFNKGFYADVEFNFGEKIALIHSELSEALEADRKGLSSDHLPGRTGVEEELADAAIRIFDLAGFLDIQLGTVIREKLEFNAQRPYKHGKAY